MRRALGCVLAALALAAAALPGADVARANPASQLYPIDLRVYGGEYAWHADNDFRLDWDRPPVSEQGFPISAVHYRVRDAAGAVVIPEVRLPWDTAQIENLHLPSGRGAYTADVWLEGPGGQTGPPVSAGLRFDDARPGAAQPLAPSGWVAGNGAAIVRIEHPSGPPPISGIRGYAISVDRGGGAPCAGPDRCSPAETDLHGGVDTDTISLGVLPEGANVVRAVAVSGSGMRSAESRSAIVHVDATRPAVTLSGVPRGWATGPVRVTARATDALSGMVAGGAGGPYTALAIDGAVPRVDAGDSTAAVVSGEGSHRVAFYACDAAGNVGDESPPVAAVRIDESPPLVAFANSQDARDPKRIEAIVSDPLSGPDPARGSIAVRPAGSHQRFLTLPTAVSAGGLVARWDSDSYPPGTYEFRASGYDAAGNAAASDRRGNGVRMVLANPAAKTPTAITAGLGGHRLTRQRYGHAIAYAGRLTSTTGSPLGHQPVQIVETFAAGAETPRRTTTVQTAVDGSFRTRLAPGPSRRIEVAFAGTRTLDRAGGGKARLQVLSGVRLHASSASARIGGAPVVFSGSVGDLGTPIGATGRPVELQFRFANGEWSEFRTVRTDAHGRFRYPYSFSDDDSRGVRFQFRAFAPEQDDWPYEPAGSRPVLITGR
jgi:hypothetical protein